MKQKKGTSARWNIVWWLFKLFGLPITPPLSMVHEALYAIPSIVDKNWVETVLGNKVVMINDAASCLGEALSHIFYSLGCKIILVSREKEELERVKNNLKNTHQTVPNDLLIISTIDLIDFVNLQHEVKKAIRVYGRIDILINNAGFLYKGDVDDANVHVETEVLLRDYFSLDKTVIRYMLRQRFGHIIDISNEQGRIIFPIGANFISAHALQEWYNYTRKRLLGRNIKFTCIIQKYFEKSLSLTIYDDNGRIYRTKKNRTSCFPPKYVAKHIFEQVLWEESADVQTIPILIESNWERSILSLEKRTTASLQYVKRLVQSCFSK